MRRAFSDYAHDSYEFSETVERLTEDFEWPEDVARKYARNHKPLYEVRADFEYDDETNELTVVSAVVNGVKLVPERTV